MAHLNKLAVILELMGYELDTDFIVIDNGDGNGPIIDEWNHVDPEPSENDIETWYNDYLSHSDRFIERKSAAKHRVDIAAEHARKRYLTFGSGQAITYIRKEAEAQAYKDARYPSIKSNYPWIKAEMDATGNTGQECADDILTQASAWLSVGTKIEKIRRLGKLSIDAANSDEDINEARDDAIVTLNVI